MRKLLGWLIFAVLAYGLIFQTPLGTKASTIWYFSPCDSPEAYKIGSIDSRFGISRDELTADVNEATSIWSTVYGKSLFVQDPNAQLTIKMVYDQRQSLNSQINNLQNQLNNQEQSLKPQEAQYEQEAAAFQQKLADFNKQVDYWNSKGGAPKDVYDQLKSEQAALQQEANKLNDMAKSLNISVRDYNSQLGTLNQQVDTFNAALAQKPEEGLYNGVDDTITIYLTSSHDELVHTLTHELGHSLGMDHVQGATSIMYPLTSSSITPTSFDLAQLQQVCAKRTLLDVFVQRLKLIIQHYKASQ